jgi:prolyl-tRNA synthetase
MHDAYSRIIEACGLDYIVVEADTGAIGGSASHEFMVLAETGESAVVRCPACGYAANVEKAEAAPLEPPPGEGATGERAEVATPGTTSVADVARHLDVPPGRIVKTLLYETQEGPVAVLIRGDREINEIKLGNVVDSPFFVLAGEETVREVSGAPVGYAGPVGLARPVRVIADESVRPLDGFVCGANRADTHLVGVRWGRDVEPDVWADLLLVAAGDGCPRCNTPLEQFRGIEVGHIFKLGTKYSESMGCAFDDEKGESHPMIMGCYGLGVGRTVAAAIEQNHDGDGIIWPLPLAPFQVLLVALNPDDEAVAEAAERLYAELDGAGVEVLYDDRAGRPGVKFKDADLIGLPIRVVVGAKSLADGKVEISLRRDRVKELVGLDRAVAKVTARIAAG